MKKAILFIFDAFGFFLFLLAYPFIALYSKVISKKSDNLLKEKSEY